MTDDIEKYFANFRAVYLAAGRHFPLSKVGTANLDLTIPGKRVSYACSSNPYDRDKEVITLVFIDGESTPLYKDRIPEDS